jgi:DNA-binding IclR family transcriptional regulator
MAKRKVASWVLRTITDLDEVKTLFMLLNYLDDQNMVTVKLTALAREYEITHAKASNAIKRLIEAGYLIRGPKVRTVSSYKVGRHVAWLDYEEDTGWMAVYEAFDTCTPLR